MNGFLLKIFFTFQDSSYDFQAYRLDANKEFTKFQTGELVGKISVNDSIDKGNN